MLHVDVRCGYKERAEGMLAVFEWKVLRKIFDPIRGDNGWCIRLAYEIMKLYGDSTTLEFVSRVRVMFGYLIG